MSTITAPVFTSKLRPEFLAPLRRKFIRRQLIICGLWAALIVAIPLVLPHAPKNAHEWIVNSIVGLLCLTPFALVAAIMIPRTIKKMTREYEFCRYDFTPDTVIRTDPDGKQMLFDLHQVTSTQRVKDKGVMLNTAKPAVFLLVPAQLEQFEEIARFVEDGRTQAPPLARLPLHFQQVLTNFVFMLCWAVVLLSPIRWTVFLAGSLCLAWSVFVIWHTQRNPNCTPATKRISWAYLCIAALIIWQLAGKL